MRTFQVHMGGKAASHMWEGALAPLHCKEQVRVMVIACTSERRSMRWGPHKRSRLPTGPSGGSACLVQHSLVQGPLCRGWWR